MSMSVSEQIRNDEYFDEKLKLIKYHLDYPRNYGAAILILKQIAIDQREAIIKKMNEEFYFRRGPNCEEPIMYASEIIAAIQNAEIGAK